MAEVLVRDLVKTYPGGTARATDEVSLEIADGEFMVLLGPSGCGKTTLLRMIAGLELPDSGQIVIGGKDVTYLEPRRRNLSMVFQSYAVFPNKKVADNIGFGLRVHGVPADEIRRKVAWAAELLQLTPYLDRYPARLSGGQRQRVAVARAIVMDADVLLMDEPLSNLDALLRLSFRAELKRLVAELGTTTIYVTHDQVEALSLGNRVAVLRDGAVVQCGPPTEVYDDPATEFVGGFLGSPPMNFLTGPVAATEAGPRFDLGGQSLAVPAALSSFAGGTLRLGIRPEAIVVREGPAEATMRGELEVLEPLGSSTLLTLRVGGQTVKVQAPPGFRAAEGDTTDLYLPPEACRWYDPETAMLLRYR
ncbi:ABC transporter ATP-binding protein [Nocardia implantans]|uniref:ABC transporter ATP-binding protein n=1 Tax=Nocardia implantans TaxID=3108168 RepID=A0ABU6ARG0_9NOCA|nr:MULTISPECIES: ABC transporter ATP-binding protein [unclassified Nocardia]MBF6191508.1 ABC transporter ATP-binding protein [Nocardia beijingensis]MEA3528185.1 ABC transporter ATP-binding protein [Nocardia sp. CDC192]MEB3510065.1 ABC transporter ATP-binding protein [Nocardia sp. CDC186]